ncbi:MAG: 2-amino-4-hydroxy-6-hydroxymethyldihydropteridine diphosphokinase [candidate division WOR-3 bacterium]
MKLAYIGIGSNMGDRLMNLRGGVAELKKLGKISRVSSVYETEPWGRDEMAWFLNAVVLIETEMSPNELLLALKSAESGFRREPERWGPRELDMDILLYQDAHIDEDYLSIPHPRMGERSFVLVPLEELFAAGAPTLGYEIKNPRPDGKRMRIFAGPEALCADRAEDSGCPKEAK